jgi:hypothetical protein
VVLIVVAPTIVAPPLAVKACVTVRAPTFVVVTPVLPILIPEVFEVPMLIVPAVCVAVPTSRVILPELLVDPVALPVVMLTPFEFVLAVLVLLLATFAATAALKA